MELYGLEVAAGVDRIPGRIPEAAAAAIIEFMTGQLLENPARAGHALLFDFRGLHAARRGPYRVVYRIDDRRHVVKVVRVDHRADVYRAL